MSGLVRAELAKIRSTRLWWGLAIAMVVYAAIQAGVGASLAGQQGTPTLDTREGLLSVWTAAAGAYVPAVILGIMSVAGEYRHQTITSTFLAEPRRWPVVVAKLVAVGLYCLLYAVVAIAVTLALAWPIVRGRGFDLFGEGVPVARILVGSLLAAPLWGAVGLAVGALVRNQVAALAATLLWVLLAEALLVGFLPTVGRWLPGGASRGLEAVTPPGTMLPQWGGALLFLGYTAALVAAGVVMVRRRDVS